MANATALPVGWEDCRNSTPPTAPVGTPSSNIPSTTSAPKKQVDPSAKLAEKMLQGWTMLERSCPQCSLPLMKNREQQMFCVGCEQYAVFPSDAPKNNARNNTTPPVPAPVVVTSPKKSYKPTTTFSSCSHSDIRVHSIDIMYQKLAKVTSQIEKESGDASRILELANVVKGLANSIQALQELSHN